MFRLRYVLAAPVAVCLLGGVAGAQPASAPPAATSEPQATQATAALELATPASATTAAPSRLIVTSTIDAFGGRHLLITNAPVPDTPENRARYGQPLSNAGQHTQPAGN